ncbi:unnamed protein product [Amoebophrya sp. A25]|nr:unnamed protein product [Amoebophrya sp. A25]|eukprot:GSA25T00024770001.1
MPSFGATRSRPRSVAGPTPSASSSSHPHYSTNSFTIGSPTGHINAANTKTKLFNTSTTSPTNAVLQQWSVKQVPPSSLTYSGGAHLSTNPALRSVSSPKSPIMTAAANTKATWKKRPRYLEEERFEQFVWGDFRLVVRHLDQLQQQLKEMQARLTTLEQQRTEEADRAFRTSDNSRRAADKVDARAVHNLEEGALSSIAAADGHSCADSAGVTADYIRTSNLQASPCLTSNSCTSNLQQGKNHTAPESSTSTPLLLAVEQGTNNNLSSKGIICDDHVYNKGRSQISPDMLDLALDEATSTVGIKPPTSIQEDERHGGGLVRGTSGEGEGSGGALREHVGRGRSPNEGAVMAERLEVLERAVLDLEKTARGSYDPTSSNNFQVPGTVVQEHEGDNDDSSPVMIFKKMKKSHPTFSEETRKKDDIKQARKKEETAEQQVDVQNVVGHELCENENQQKASPGHFSDLQKQQERILRTLKSKVLSRRDGEILNADLRDLQGRFHKFSDQIVEALRDKADIDNVNTALALKSNLTLVKDLKRDLSLKANMSDVMLLLRQSLVGGSGGG